ncbi:MAG: PQQ-binding-like beta-propeller repeat protein [Planctomycetota bacterium]
MMRLPVCSRIALGLAVGFTVIWFAFARGVQADSDAVVELQGPNGICVVLGLLESEQPESIVEMAANGEFQIYFQTPEAAHVRAVRREAADQGLLGTRLFAGRGAYRSIQLASNLADRMRVAAAVEGRVPNAEILRVLKPGGVANVGSERLVKPKSARFDDWSHVYHGPDNNPKSVDRVARAPFRTQFLGTPLFSPMPEVTVASGGRIFKAFGHLAHKKNQNAVLNTLFCINAYNGTILWKRPLHRGFMIHRNTMIATPDVFYLADDISCKMIDPASGAVRDEIVVPEGLADGPVWKWMALEDDILYALVGAPEVRVDTMTSDTRGIGHWPWGMWKGHDYADPRTNFGFGRTFLAIDPSTNKILWSYRDSDYIDARGVCMSDGRIYFYSPEKFLACLDAECGDVAWKNSNDALLQAIGPNGRAQHYVTGFATTCYLKCKDRKLFFAGPQRERFVVASAEDGHVLWQKRQGNVQVVLRDNGIYCAGPQRNDDTAGAVYSYDGERLASLPIRRACTRATGSIDSVFYRTSGGTVRVNTADNSAEHIAPVRPPCQDGVIISDGLLFWGPWMCGCQLSLYGHVALGPAEGSAAEAPAEPRLRSADGGDPDQVQAFSVKANDWPAYKHDHSRSSFTPNTVPASIKLAWQRQVVENQLPTAPIVAGNTTFVADRSGVVQAIDRDGQPIWKVYTGGPIYYPPTLEDGRLFLGSADGRVYALEAASGRRLWSYRLAPRTRRIPVYGHLISTWPVAGGVVVKDGVVYAAAGIAHYDGTYVAALDAASGALVWKNDTSGALAKDVNCGISLQGELCIRDGELQFLGGGPYQRARYDLETGECLNEPRHEVTSLFHTAFYPYYPRYAKYSALNHTFRDGTTVQYNPSYDGRQPTRLAVLAPAGTQPKGDSRAAGDEVKQAPRRKRQGKGSQRRRIWNTDKARLYTAFVVTPHTLIVGGPAERSGENPQLSALSLNDGTIPWQRPLESPPVKSGIAMDGQQRIVVAMENGNVLCFTPGR